VENGGVPAEKAEYRQQQDDYYDHDDPQKNPLSRRELLPHIVCLQVADVST